MRLSNKEITKIVILELESHGFVVLGHRRVSDNFTMCKVYKNTQLRCVCNFSNSISAKIYLDFSYEHRTFTISFNYYEAYVKAAIKFSELILSNMDDVLKNSELPQRITFTCISHLDRFVFQTTYTDEVSNFQISEYGLRRISKLEICHDKSI